MAPIVLDASALIAFLQQKEGGEKVTYLFEQASKQNKKLHIASVNWGEVYYYLLHKKGKELADKVMMHLEGMPLEIVDVDKFLAKRAGFFKVTKNLAYSDSFVAALAQQMNAKLYTSDHDFKKVEHEIHIGWLC